MKTNNILKKAIIAGLLMSSASAFAIPALQLGGGGTGEGGPATDLNWSYNTTTDTWINNGDNVFNVDLTARNPVGNGNGPNSGAFDSGNPNQLAYLVFSAAPKQSNATDVFTISLINDAISFVSSGFGAPPLTDPNSLPSHGIFDTYFEIYQIAFNGGATKICNTQPVDSTDCINNGFLETVNVTVNSLATGITGIHMDLYTLGSGTNAGQVFAFAPFSHDAEWAGTLTPPPPPVPEPTAVWMLGLGLLGLVGYKRRQGKLAA